MKNPRLARRPNRHGNHQISSDRRGDARHVVHAALGIQLQDGRRLAAHSLDLGSNGLSCLLDQPLTNGSACSLVIALPIAGQRVVVKTMARVVYAVCRGMDGFCIRLRFVDLPEPAASAIARCLDEH